MKNKHTKCSREVFLCRQGQYFQSHGFEGVKES